MDPEGIRSHIEPSTIRDRETFGIIAFSSDYENAIPLQCTIATATKNVTFNVYKGWYKNLQKDFIGPMDISVLKIYGGYRDLTNLLKQILPGVSIQNYYCKSK
ncbi:hypothetical protein NPIL_258971 [Nephila pilipes]|uniref:Uncharacterized protein n=1 Tax=Nephila pilipes TaxID=299642 RepID=A0A8X6QG68_NEPPI|nr:hypothetical protein NPIL_258971 [Nephila pilipes]